MTKGERIRQRREQLGMTQISLADKVGVSKQNLYKYENDIITNIPSNIIEKIAVELNCSPSYLMGWEKIIDEDGVEYTYCDPDAGILPPFPIPEGFIFYALTKFETKIIEAYRSSPMQDAVLTLLDLKRPEEQREKKQA